MQKKIGPFQQQTADELKSRRRQIAISITDINRAALCRCLEPKERGMSEFVLRFSPKNSKSQKTPQPQVELLTLEKNPLTTKGRFLQSLGRVSVYTVEGSLIFSAVVPYYVFVDLVYAQNAYWPLHKFKDNAFRQTIKRDVKKYVPFSMIVSNNGHSPTTLRRLREKFPIKIKPDKEL